jgi:hypothetical protein
VRSQASPSPNLARRTFRPEYVPRDLQRDRAQPVDIVAVVVHLRYERKICDDCFRQLDRDDAGDIIGVVPGAAVVEEPDIEDASGPVTLGMAANSNRSSGTRL